MNKDTVVGVVGAVILIAAMVGVFRFEGSQTPSSLGSRSFDVTWVPATVNGPGTDDTTALGESTDGNLTLTAANLTRVEFTLAWTAQNGRDTLQLTVTPPPGVNLDAQTATADSGEVTVGFDVPNATPPSLTAFGNNESDAQARLARTHTKTLGTGEWTFTVNFTAASGLLPPPAPPVGQDEAVAWTLTSSLTQYTPSLKAK